MRKIGRIPRWWGKRAFASIVLGAATCWLVAWLCALPISRSQFNQGRGAFADEQQLVRLMEVRALGMRMRTWMLDDLTRDNIHAQSARRQADKVRELGGAAAMEASIQGGRSIAASLEQIVPEIPRAAPLDALAAEGPPWRIEQSDIPDGGLMTNEFAHGWPFLALRGRCDIGTLEGGDQPNGLPKIESTMRFSRCLHALWPWSSARARARGGGRVALPLEPLWLGFTGNVGAYSAAWLPLLVGPSLVRRWWRARHGRCRACGYDLSAIDGRRAGCPECGWNRGPSAPTREAKN